MGNSSSSDNDSKQTASPGREVSASSGKEFTLSLNNPEQLLSICAAISTAGGSVNAVSAPPYHKEPVTMWLNDDPITRKMTDKSMEQGDMSRCVYKPKGTHVVEANTTGFGINTMCDDLREKGIEPTACSPHCLLGKKSVFYNN